jgi:acetyltransferase-like isoleucine patch superfamily enzyme
VTVLYSIPWVRGSTVAIASALLRVGRESRFGAGLRAYGWPIVRCAPGSTLVVGRNAMLISDSRFSEPGVSHPCVLRTLRSGASLTVGDNVGMSGCSICAAECVSIGDDCLLGADVLITDTDFHAVDPEGRRWRKDGVRTASVHIGRNVFIGARSMVLKGVSIGDDAVVGAGSVVTSDVPAGAVAAGSPARVIGSVTAGRARGR